MGTLRLIAVGAFGLVVLLIVTSNAQSRYQAGLLSAAGPAAVVEALSAEEDFIATGVLTLYRHNGALRPWLLYETEDSAAATKALVFTDRSICDAGTGMVPCGADGTWLARQYGGMQVRLVGTVRGEHAVVERLFPASAPDERIALVQAGLGESVTALGATITVRSLAGDAGVAIARAEVAHDGIAEELVFEQGTLVGAGQRQITLTHTRAGTLYFAVALDI